LSSGKPVVFCCFVCQGRKKATKASVADEDDDNWDGEREKFVKILLQLLQLNVQRLWDPPIVEEEFVRYISLQIFCYRFVMLGSLVTCSGI